jgi:hypothetical protein
LVNNRAWLRYTRQVGMWELMPLQARDYLGHGDKLALQLAVKIREFTLGVGWLLGPDKGVIFNSIKDIIADHFSDNPQAGCRVTYPISRFSGHVDAERG